MTEWVVYFNDGTEQVLVPRDAGEVMWLDPSQTWAYFLHDYQTPYWSIQRDIPEGKHRGFPRKAVGQPETVATFEKEERNKLTPAWQEFYKRLCVIAVYGKPDLRHFPAISEKFNSVMADNRVISNFKDWREGYMTLAMGGNVGKVIGESRPNAKIGPCWTFETLNSSGEPPDPEEVFWNKPWLWQKATISRYAKPEENKPIDPWQSVDPFSQFGFDRHVPLMFINNRGVANIPKMRCRILRAEALREPINAYNPPLEMVYE